MSALGLGNYITKAGSPAALGTTGAEDAVGTIPYTKSLYWNGTNGYMGADTDGSPNTQDAAVFADFDPILKDASATWSLEFDYLIHPESTNAYNTAFQFEIGGVGWLEVRCYRQNATKIRLQFYIYRYVDSKQYHCQFSFTITDDTHAITNALDPTGTWLRLSLCKSSDVDIRNITYYVNGYDNGHSRNTWGNHTDYELDDDLEGTDDGSRRILINEGGTDTAFGMIALYDKELSEAEVNENYDGGARAGGSADASEIMVQDLRETSTSSNLKYYNFLDTAVDTVSNVVNGKVGAGSTPMYFTTVNQTIAEATSQSVPQVPLFKAGSAPMTVYATEAQTFTQPASGTSGTTVKWYSDAGFTSEVEEGTTYSFTAPSAGAQNLYVKETKTWAAPYGSVAQTANFSYTSSDAGFSTHSFISHDNTTGKALLSPALADDSVFDAVNGITFSWWWASDHKYSWMKLMDSNNNLRTIGAGGWSTGQATVHIKSNAGNLYKTFSGSYYNGTANTWNHSTIAWDWDTGTLSHWANGNFESVTHSDYEEAFTAGGNDTIRINIGNNWTNLHVNQISVYKGALTQAEGEALCNGGDPGDSVDIESLSSYSKIIEHWQCGDTDTFNNDASDHLNATEDSAHDIPVANSEATRKTIVRP